MEGEKKGAGEAGGHQGKERECASPERRPNDGVYMYPLSFPLMDSNLSPFSDTKMGSECLWDMGFIWVVLLWVPGLRGRIQ